MIKCLLMGLKRPKSPGLRGEGDQLSSHNAFMVVLGGDDNDGDGDDENGVCNTIEQ